MSIPGHDNPHGYTTTESEGKWSRVDSGLMKYERASPQTYGPPTSQAWRDGWERIFGGKVKALHEGQKWATSDAEPRDFATVVRVDGDNVKWRDMTADGFSGNWNGTEAEFRAAFPVLVEEASCPTTSTDS